MSVQQIFHGRADLVSSGIGSDPFGGLVINERVGAGRFYAQGFDGTGVTLANVEAGHAWRGHEALGHAGANVRFDGNGAAGADDRHATWVSHALGGRGPQDHQQGLAPGAQLWSVAIATGWAGSAYTTGFSLSPGSAASAYNRVTGAGSNGGHWSAVADVVNSSWGFAESTGFNVLALGVDGQINDSGVVAVFSAGNDGVAGANTVGGIGAGYNGITVAALGSDTDDPAYDKTSDFSSRGPNDAVLASSPTTGTRIAGVRAGVDIAAPGQDLTLAYYGGTTGGNGSGLAGSPDGPSGSISSYSSGMAGTSFAAPVVAGGAALVVNAGKALYGGGPAVDGRVVKAVLLNAADKTAGWDNGQRREGNVVRTAQSLDYQTGAGRINLDRTYDNFIGPDRGGRAGTTDVPETGSGDLGDVDRVGWDFGAVQSGSYNLYFIDDLLYAGETLLSTLTWFVDRNPGSAADFSGLGEEHFANLDLKVFLFDSLIDRNVLSVVGESVSNFNPVEHLALKLPQTGYYGIAVSYSDALWNFTTETSEHYGLAWAVSSPPTAPLLVLGGLALALARGATFRSRAFANPLSDLPALKHGANLNGTRRPLPQMLAATACEAYWHDPR